MNANFLLDTISHIYIGNGIVYNFIDYIGDINVTGGILNYTRNYRLLENNLFNNFSEGMQGRYGYGRGEFLHAENLDSNQYYSVARNEAEVEMVSLAQDKVGEIYSFPNGAKNSKLAFLSESGFITLADAIREENLKHNIRTDIFKTRYGYYNPFIASGVSFPAEIGDYIVDTGFRRGYQGYVLARKTLKDNKSFLEQARLVNDKVNNTVNGKSIKYQEYDVGSDDEYKVRLRIPFRRYTISNETNKNLKSELLKYRIVNKTIQNSKYRVDEINDEYFVDKDVKIPLIEESLLGGVIEVNQDIITKNTTRDFGNAKGYYKDSYGVKEDAKTVYYSILDTNKLNDRTSIDQSAKGGSMITKVSKVGNNLTYTYFQEPDGKSTTSIGRTNTYNNFTPVLMSDAEEKGVSKLLQKTNKLFKDCKIGSLINRFHTETITNPSDLETSYSVYGMSRGRNLLRGGTSKISGYDNPYCRVWTAHHQYSKLKDRIRPFMEGDSPKSIESVQRGLGSLRSYEGPGHFAAHTVLQNNGYVRIGPTSGEKSQNIQNFMFSIENLAWKGHTAILKKTQVGPNGGRIMWFPPYNLKFSENVNVQWQDNSFIGRGEKIYTYTNTERTGTLNFTLLVDHPSILDAWRTDSGRDVSNDSNEERILRFFAGCESITLQETKKPEEKEMVESIIDGTVEQVEEVEQEVPQEEAEPAEVDEGLESEGEYYEREAYIIFFPNDFSGYDNLDEGIEILNSYESDDSSSTTDERDEAFQNEVLLPKNRVNKNLFKLNTLQGLGDNIEKIKEELGVSDYDGSVSFISYDKMEEILNESYADQTREVQYEIVKMQTIGFASSHGKTDRNKLLCQRRQEFIAKLAQHFCTAVSLDSIEKLEPSIIGVTDVSGTPDVNTLEAKIARSAILFIQYKDKANVPIPSDSTAGGVVENGGTVENDEFIDPVPLDLDEEEAPQEITINYVEEDPVVINEEAPEYEYFSTLQSTDSLAYKRIVDKIRYFVPAFHSLTPEGFNERLNFLHQCTRQGPTEGSATSGEIQETNTNKMAGNLAFGRAPYCVLRIGDFFHTKICIQSLSYSFDTNGGIQWDLNPEGAGVQPMIADVSMNFTFVGGQDIGGVVQELQNAISENFYANSSVYNNRAKREGQ